MVGASCALLLAAGGLAACGSAAKVSLASSASVGSGAATAIPTSVPAGVTLRVADQLNNLNNVLKASGEDTNFPYKVVYSQFVGGPPMLQAFQAGAEDVGFVADSPLIFAQAAKQKVVGVAAWAPESGALALVSAPGVHLSGWASLKGKKVAYQQGTVLEAAVLEGLQSVGLSLKDITSVNLPTTSISAALENGSVSAGILAQPLTAAYLVKEPSAAQVVRANQITDRVDFLIADTSSLSSPGKEAAIADYIGRLQKGYDWINRHPTEWAQDLYVDQYKLPLATATKLEASSGATTFLSLPGTLVPPPAIVGRSLRERRRDPEQTQRGQ
jgi:sulfonate transport system substrate-binding protein